MNVNPPHNGKFYLVVWVARAHPDKSETNAASWQYPRLEAGAAHLIMVIAHNTGETLNNHTP